MGTGKGKEDYAIISSIVLIVLTAVLVNINKIKLLFMPADDAEGMTAFENFINYFTDRFYILFVIALITMVGSYFASVWIAGRKRGIV